MVQPLASDDPQEVGPYRIGGRLGTSGHVYFGHTADGAAVAVTVARPGDDPGFGARFDRALAAAGDHLRGWDPKAAHPWLAVVFGPLLRTVVDERGALPAGEVLALTAGIADALAALHNVGLVHGVLGVDTVVADGPRLIGFGPDEGEPAADVLELGALIIYLATGRPGAPADEVPAPLRDVARRCTAADPADRPQAAEVAEFCRSHSDPLAYVGTEPPANPLDLSEGIPPDAIVGPVPPGQADEPAEDPLAYTAIDPPENPLDLSAGIPGGAIVGPIPADAPPDEPEALTYRAAAPPENPLDLSAGIPAHAIVGPVPPADETAAVPPQPAYPAGTPPENPLDLSAGIPADAIVGPVPPADDTAAVPPQLTYSAGAPPTNPTDLSAGIPADAVVGPVSPIDEPVTAPAGVGPASTPEAVPIPITVPTPADLVGTDAPKSPPVGLPELSASLQAEATALPVPVADANEDSAVATAEPQLVVTAPPIDPHDLAALRAAADAVEAAAIAVEPVATGGDSGHVLEPVGYSQPETLPDGPDPPGPPVHDRRRRLIGLAAAILLAAAVIVPLVHRNTTAGTPVAADRPTATEQAVPTTETTAPACDGSKNLTGSGSAFQRIAVTTIAQQWTVRCPGSALDYVPAGTTFGVQQFATGEADLAVADHVLGASQGEIATVAARCAGVGAPANKDLVVQVPIVLTPIALAYNLPGVDELRLDPPAISAILSGRIVKWNDRALTELNPEARLPATAITVVARADDAQSTQTLQQYLTAVGGWRSGEGEDFTGKATTYQRSDADVFAAVRAVAGAIGYLPYPLVSPTREPVVSLVIGDRATPPNASAVNAATNSALRNTDDYTRLPDAIYHATLDEEGDGTLPYPLVHLGYVVACAQYPDERTTAAVRDFLLTALGMQVASANGFQVPFGDLRLALVDLVQRTY